MRNKFSQKSLFDIYYNVSDAIEERKLSFLDLLYEHLTIYSLIPIEFYRAFYKYSGIKRIYFLENFIRFFLLQKFIGIDTDSALLCVLSFSKELRDFCGFVKIPDAAKIIRFKLDSCDYLADFFHHLVYIRSPIYRELSMKKSNYSIFDTSDFALPVAENNPKFFNSKRKQTKAMHKSKLYKSIRKLSFG